MFGNMYSFLNSYALISVPGTMMYSGCHCHQTHPMARARSIRTSCHPLWQLTTSNTFPLVHSPKSRRAQRFVDLHIYCPKSPYSVEHELCRALCLRNEGQLVKLNTWIVFSVTASVRCFWSKTTTQSKTHVWLMSARNGRYFVRLCCCWEFSCLMAGHQNLGAFSSNTRNSCAAKQFVRR